MKFFDIDDKTGRKIYLSNERWSHIRMEHPCVKQEEIKLALQKPVK